MIYQTDEEFEGLSEEYRWRHVRYEPNRDEPIDFTWEREWRIKGSAISFTPSNAGIVVPNADWALRMISEHKAEQDFKIFHYSEMLDDEMLAEQHREPFPWRISRLR